MDKKGKLALVPFSLGLIFPLFAGLALFTIGFIAKYGKGPFTIILVLSSIFGTFLGFSMQRITGNFEN